MAVDTKSATSVTKAHLLSSTTELMNGGLANGLASQYVAKGSNYEIKDQWHSEPSQLRIIHVGAGAAGLLMAYKMKKTFQNYDLICYEK